VPEHHALLRAISVPRLFTVILAMFTLLERWPTFGLCELAPSSRRCRFRCWRPTEAVRREAAHCTTALRKMLPWTRVLWTNLRSGRFESPATVSSRSEDCTAYISSSFTSDDLDQHVCEEVFREVFWTTLS